MAKIVWSKAAFQDLRKIFDFIATDSEYYAQKVIEKIKARVLILATQQRIGRVVPDFNNELIRELFEYNYRIVYRIESATKVVIVRIYHQSQNLSD